jgi:hypothetical protein
MLGIIFPFLIIYEQTVPCGVCFPNGYTLLFLSLPIFKASNNFLVRKLES